MFQHQQYNPMAHPAVGTIGGGAESARTKYWNPIHPGKPKCCEVGTCVPSPHCGNGKFFCTRKINHVSIDGSIFYGEDCAEGCCDATAAGVGIATTLGV